MVDARPEQDPEFAEKVKFDVPHSARIWNYWQGGKDNYEVDRRVGDAVAEAFPDIVRQAQQARMLLIRVVRYLAGEAGIRQFLDIGTGLPSMQNTHEVAQAVAPEAKVVYVDNDPLVLTHARALLTNTTFEGVTAYIDANLDDPELIIADAHNVLNFREPIAVIFFGILGHIAEFDRARSIVARIMDAVPSGSYLAIEDSTDTGEGVREAARLYAEGGTIPYHLRSPDQLAQCFTGLELVDPGLVQVTQWRPNRADIAGTVEPIDMYGGVARKP
ncbi:MAG: SAM-dependent methyltransferase [Pseudonocardia sp.]|nr:SAM-dependent methyltransferase [Pseudonocardia sp.]